MATPAFRARAACTLLAALALLTRLLADPSPLVRYHAAASLARAGDRRGVPVLLALLGEGPAPLANRAVDLLCRIAGEQAPPGAPDDWASVEPLPGGRYLMALNGAHKVVETDATGKVLWECATPSPVYAARLPGGNTLVANEDGRFVSEVDRHGKEVWRKATKGRPFHARRY